MFIFLIRGQAHRIASTTTNNSPLNDGLAVAFIPSVHKHRARQQPGSVVQLKKMFFNTTYTMKPIIAVKQHHQIIFCARVFGVWPGKLIIITT
ncbi:hypothetical protein WK72_02915 [Burkholderia ubonensis]|nr:hypothetical protein WI84_05455 [Burkholderia ubonensis]KVP44146.1 hypothetical protein WJ87_31325 [Burkholderia ubonensis]KVQ07905.1 hypothetical protein WK00_08625 [Burkholderia ubonensis]KVQ09702.1 hypothetical protein WJ98_00010 [Burkholderia ubonensis]KVU74738.1 hypothetical protein WK72_02915 [Burkholderia ubonensis]